MTTTTNIDKGMEQKAEFKQKLLTLRNSLPRGAGKEIALKLKLSQVYVSLVLNGKRFNPHIIEEAIAIRNRERARYHQLTEMI